MGELVEVLKAIVFDSTAVEKAKLSRVAFRFFLTISILWIVGAFSTIGFRGMARAEDVDEKIQQAVQSSTVPLAKQLQAVITTQNDQAETLRQIRMDQLSQKLREFQRLWCNPKLDLEARVRIEQEIETSQRQYKTLAGERYSLGTCPGGH